MVIGRIGETVANRQIRSASEMRSLANRLQGTAANPSLKPISGLVYHEQGAINLPGLLCA